LQNPSNALFDTRSLYAQTSGMIHGDSPGVGLVNFSQVCYGNAAMQLIAAAIQQRHGLVDMKVEIDLENGHGGLMDKLVPMISWLQGGLDESPKVGEMEEILSELLGAQYEFGKQGFATEVVDKLCDVMGVQMSQNLTHHSVARCSACGKQCEDVNREPRWIQVRYGDDGGDDCSTVCSVIAAKAKGVVDDRVCSACGKHGTFKIFEEMRGTPDLILVDLDTLGNGNARATRPMLDQIISINDTSMALVGFIVFEGDTHESGHFYSVRMGAEHGTWLICNDADVRMVFTDEAQRISSDACVAVYRALSDRSPSSAHCLPPQCDKVLPPPSPPRHLSLKLSPHPPPGATVPN
jgi:hypothetical protein